MNYYSKNIQVKYYDRLVRWFIENSSKVIIALSGGVDSAVVAMAAKEALGENALAVTANYNTLSLEELNSASNVSKELKINHKIIQYNELEDQRFRLNDKKRCYYCRNELGNYLIEEAKIFGADLIVDGANLDDLKEYRPGITALREHGIRSPLIENGLAKENIRKIAQIKGLSIFDKPSNSCLASRIPTGMEITKEKIIRVERSETIIKRIYNIRQVRVRDHNDIARIEIPKAEFDKFFNKEKMNLTSEMLKEVGFKFITFDLEGYRPGSTNDI